MGITIHYSGKMDDPRLLPDLLTAARHFCFQRKWKYIDVDDRILGTVERWIPSDDEHVRTQESRIDDTLRGIIIQPHPKSESVFLTFNQGGELCFYMPESEPGHYWENKLLFTKTQFAPLDIHISICELLQLVRDKYFPSLCVVDEGEYWETRDPAHLAQNFGKLNAIMDQVANARQDPDHPLTQEIQRAVDDPKGTDVKQDKRKQKGFSIERGAKIKLPDPLWKRGHGRSAGRN
jgi:hypothetical protein